MNIVEEIRSAFSVAAYPRKDFYQAVAEMDYLDCSPGGSERKLWDEITVEELKRHYDVLLFLDADGIQYYLPSYMTLFLKDSTLFDHSCFDSFLMTVADLDSTVLSTVQWRAILSFIDHCRTVVSKQIELDEELLMRGWHNANQNSL